MNEKKKTTREFVDAMKSLRKRRPDPALIDRFNKIVEEDDRKEREKADAPSKKKIARGPEADA